MLKLIGVLALALSPVVAAAQDGPLIIAHRGASGERPEHTLAAYERAIDQGADYIEPDLVVTKDLVLVARHENEIGGTTDVATRDEFRDRRRSKMVDGELISGWFAEDFTLAELRILRAKERLPGIRPANTRFDGLYSVPTFADIVTLVRAKEAETGRTIGIYPELKHPTFLLQDAGIDMVDLLVAELRRSGFDGADDAIFVQSFEVEVLKRLDRMLDVKLVQLVKDTGGPADLPGVTYANMLSPSGLADIAAYADGIGAPVPLLLGPAGTALPLIDQAKQAGLQVHVWTVRKENAFLPEQLRGSGGPAQTGCDESLYATIASTGIDGVFTDDPGRMAAPDPTNNTVCMGGG
ncbi:glycerophosphodiester phosphodiesterase family protein [Qipengyuania sp. DSG2-2]|uniref:glycerophosphodiester phosphodiesterase family protein n=1 Tax=Qipengyuania sp. DGS2-2 TaxID=3349631 RepID=UPI0036D2923B